MCASSGPSSVCRRRAGDFAASSADSTTEGTSATAEGRSIRFSCGCSSRRAKMVSRTRKLRGSRTHGRGKKHGRGAGGRGGNGVGGPPKKKIKWVIKDEPGKFWRARVTPAPPPPRKQPIQLQEPSQPIGGVRGPR